MTAAYRRNQFKRADSPEVVFHVEIAAGEHAAALRMEQARVIMEVLKWAASDATSPAVDPRQAG